ncbi:MAG: hypothetical protein K8H88_22510, partial [Sandaracinaceae bacterium]|nr:hypothetical protein [Sandaracinaceae bacterium]
MSVYQTPGVHVRAVQPPPAIRALRTDVAGLVGIAERGPLHEAVRTTSWEQFRATFGGLRPGAWLPHAVQGFFSNGGRVAWIVRVADPDAASSAWASVPSAGSSSRLIVRARSPGAWGRRLVARLTRLILASTTLDGDRVASTRGLRPGIVARVRRPGAADQHVVLASVELASGRVQWRVPPAGLGPARLDVLGLGLSVFEQSRLVEQHSGLGLDAFAGVDRPAAAEPPIAEAIAERSTRIFVEEAGGDPLDLPLQGDYPLDRDGADGLSTLRPDHFAGEATQARVWGLHA